ncbi:hypothetical protein [Microbacterium sp. SORGH_AS_0888]|uniref:hypothetical protein n=1 Tax=Microbacterium sp. SORGH_AS_0888 TaxID=3041791 RepID=UPI0027869E24|nr:hypothetical protein [Microbacterium sp. SORGH_AS_0888]MDQ1131027.1 hypothetical protein [Microbacterium sp. SORGH_AS_0888]
MDSTVDRYDGKPMLRFLDAYVLDALGALDDTTSRRNVEMAPKLAAALHVDATTWQEAVEKAMEMPPDSADALRSMWEHHVYETIAAGSAPDVLAWTHALVDSRFQQG